MVEVFGQTGVGHVDGLPAWRKHQSVCWLEKEERWLTSRKAHFFGMFFVITAYAINAVHGELFCFSDNGNADNGWRRKKVLHGVEREEKWVELSNPPSLMPCGMATSIWMQAKVRC
jgi:hypothetical protein